MSAQPSPQSLLAADLKTVAAVMTTTEKLGTLKNLLPEGMRPERFIECALNYLAQHPSLLRVDRESLYIAMQDAAQDGLYIDGKEAAVTAFKKKISKTEWGTFAEYIPMVDGIAKKLGQAGVTIDTQLVYENDIFDVSLGDNPSITHKLPPRGTPRGKHIDYAYAIVHLPNGLVRREIMDREDLDAIRNSTKSKNSDGEIVGPWKDHPGEMCRKTVFKRAQKRLPALDPALERLLKRGEEPIEGESTEVDPAATQAIAAPTTRPKALAAVIAQEAPAVVENEDPGFEEEDLL